MDVISGEALTWLDVMDAQESSRGCQPGGLGSPSWLHIMATWVSSLCDIWALRTGIPKSPGTSQRPLRPHFRSYLCPFYKLLAKIWTPAHIPGKEKQTLLLGDFVTNSQCKGTCGVGGMVVSIFGNTVCCGGSLRNQSRLHSEWLKLQREESSDTLRLGPNVLLCPGQSQFAPAGTRMNYQQCRDSL